jgi:hypothetical protein
MVKVQVIGPILALHSPKLASYSNLSIEANREIRIWIISACYLEEIYRVQCRQSKLHAQSRTLPKRGQSRLLAPDLGIRNPRISGDDGHAAFGPDGKVTADRETETLMLRVRKKSDIPLARNKGPEPRPNRIRVAAHPQIVSALECLQEPAAIVCHSKSYQTSWRMVLRGQPHTGLVVSTTASMTKSIVD